MIRSITPADRELYLALAKEFYASEAVDHPVPPEHFERTFAELMRSDDYAEAFILEHEGETAGYALLAKSYSQEAGGRVVWIEELYILPQLRGLGLGTEFLDFMKQRFSPVAAGLRLEVEPENERATALYKRNGFRPLPYRSLVLDL